MFNAEQARKKSDIANNLDQEVAGLLELVKTMCGSGSYVLKIRVISPRAEEELKRLGFTVTRKESIEISW